MGRHLVAGGARERAFRAGHFGGATAEPREPFVEGLAR
jgi:hypothetical protein